MTSEDAGPWTAANLVTFARLAAIPAFLWLLLAEDDIQAATVLFFVIGATDWLDGQLARRLKQTSELGRIIDPLADRLAIVAAVVAGALADILPAWFVIPLLAREAILGFLALLLVARDRQVIQVKFLGRLATFVVYGAIPAFFLAAAGVAASVLNPLAVVAGAAGLALYWWVGVLYVGDYRRLLKEEARTV